VSRRIPLSVRFERRVVKQDDGCWTWAGAHDPTGYGITYGDLADGRGYRKLYAHRVSHELHKGQIPPKYDIDHLCRNRGCCNPDHLEAVTRRENLMRGETVVAYHRGGGICPFAKCPACKPRRSKLGLAA
jgi:hypothetical protein